nr:uncharacterized protein LOC115269846 [Aedes albopictus]
MTTMNKKRKHKQTHTPPPPPAGLIVRPNVASTVTPRKERRLANKRDPPTEHHLGIKKERETPGTRVSAHPTSTWLRRERKSTFIRTPEAKRCGRQDARKPSKPHWGFVADWLRVRTSVSDSWITVTATSTIKWLLRIPKAKWTPCKIVVARNHSVELGDRIRRTEDRCRRRGYSGGAVRR